MLSAKTATAAVILLVVQPPPGLLDELPLVVELVLLVLESRKLTASAAALDCGVATPDVVVHLRLHGLRSIKSRDGVLADAVVLLQDGPGPQPAWVRPAGLS